MAILAKGLQEYHAEELEKNAEMQKTLADMNELINAKYSINGKFNVFLK